MRDSVTEETPLSIMQKAAIFMKKALRHSVPQTLVSFAKFRAQPFSLGDEKKWLRWRWMSVRIMCAARRNKKWRRERKLNLPRGPELRIMTGTCARWIYPAEYRSLFFPRVEFSFPAIFPCAKMYECGYKRRNSRKRANFPVCLEMGNFLPELVVTDDASQTRLGETLLERRLKAWLALDALDCPIFKRFQLAPRRRAKIR